MLKYSIYLGNLPPLKGKSHINESPFADEPVALLRDVNTSRTNAFGDLATAR